MFCHVVSLAYVCMLQIKLPHCSYVQAAMRMHSKSKEQLPVFRVTFMFKTTKDGRYWNLLPIICCIRRSVVIVHALCWYDCRHWEKLYMQSVCVWCNGCSIVEHLLLMSLTLVYDWHCQTGDYSLSVLCFGASASVLNKFCLLCSMFCWTSRSLISACKCWVSLNRW